MADDRAPGPVVPVSLDRAALERVLARATELQARATEPAERLTEQQILELGGEVGLAPELIRQALAEERTRIEVPAEEGFAGRFFGPAAASAVRTVSGTPESALADLDVWMQREEILQMRRRFPDRMIWESRTDIYSAIRRGLRRGSRGYMLSRANEIAATAVALDGGRVMVRLDADMSYTRRARVRESGGVAVLGAASSAGFVAVSSMVLVHATLAIAAAAAVALVPIGVGLAGAYAIARTHHGHAARMQLALEQVLDRLEHGEIRRGGPSLLDVILK